MGLAPQGLLIQASRVNLKPRRPGPPDHLHETNRLILRIAANPTDPVPTRESPRFSTISLLTQTEIPDIFTEWQDSLRVESVITKSTHFVALLEHPRNSPHRAAWVSTLSPFIFSAAPARRPR